MVKEITPETFNVLDAIEGRSYPEDTVTIFTDAASGYVLQTLKHQHVNATPETVEGIEKELAKAEEKINETALIFHLKGFAPSKVTEIDEAVREKFEIPVDEDIDNLEADVFKGEVTIAATIVKVSRADGSEDTQTWTQEKVKALRGTLPPSEYEKLLLKVIELTYASTLFEGVVGPDFS